jgi:DNA-binding transcriptional regulator YdaS (Cro superfamily)
MEAIINACKIAGGTKKLALTLGVSQSAIAQWCSGVRPVPVERCFAIEQATGGAVTRRDLCPDKWHLIWPELAAKDATPPGRELVVIGEEEGARAKKRPRNQGGGRA